MLALDLVPLGEDLLGEALGQITLDLGDLFAGGEVFGVIGLGLGGVDGWGLAGAL